MRFERRVVITVNGRHRRTEFVYLACGHLFLAIQNLLAQILHGSRRATSHWAWVGLEVMESHSQEGHCRPGCMEFLYRSPAI